MAFFKDKADRNGTIRIVVAHIVLFAVLFVLAFFTFGCVAKKQYVEQEQKEEKVQSTKRMISVDYQTGDTVYHIYKDSDYENE